MTTYSMGTYNGVRWRRRRVTDAYHAATGRAWMYFVREPDHPLHDNGYSTLAELQADCDGQIVKCRITHCH